MNKALEPRTRPEFYEELATVWRSLKLPEEVIAETIACRIKEAKDLYEGRCPQCGAPSARYVDYKRQQGDKDMPGVWVQYRCSTQPPIGELRPPGVCDFMMDCVEGPASN